MAARIKQVFLEAASANIAFAEGRILSSRAVVAVQSQRSLPERETKAAVRWWLDGTAAPFPFELRAASLTAFSPSGKHMLVVRNDVKVPVGGSGEPQQFVELWSQSRFVVAIPTAGKHGKINAKNAVFDSITWNKAENKVIYTAEATPVEGVTHFDEAKAAQVPGAKYDAKFGWGEQLYKSVAPRLFLLDLDTKAITQLFDKADALADASLGQAVFTPDESAVVLTAYRNDPTSRLGITYCWNRHSAIYKATLGDVSVVTRLSEDNVFARSPGFSPAGDRLVWLQSKVGGPHIGGTKLVQLNWHAGVASVETVIDVSCKAMNEAVSCVTSFLFR